MAFPFIPSLVGFCAALAVAWIMILTYNFLVRSVSEIHAYRRHEEWKEQIFSAWRR